MALIYERLVVDNPDSSLSVKPNGDQVWVPAVPLDGSFWWERIGDAIGVITGRYRALDLRPVDKKSFD